MCDLVDIKNEQFFRAVAGNSQPNDNDLDIELHKLNQVYYIFCVKDSIF
jgi:hypothetical protein